MSLSLQCWDRAAVHTPSHLIKPTMSDIFIPQSSGVAMLFKPGCVGDEPFGKGALQPV